ncbi:MAG: GtrA family protein [Candidatus Moraniibacteriota bacterium]
MPTENIPPQTTVSIGTRKDYIFGLCAGLAIGLLLLPILQTLAPGLYLSLRFVLVPLFAILTILGLVIASWIARRIAIVWQIAKFIVVGGLNTLVDLGILTWLSLAILPPETPWISIFGSSIAIYSLYKGISFILANINSYYWNKYWTFHANSSSNTGTEFTSFFAVSLIGFLINISVASGIFHFVHLSVTANQLGLLAAAIGSIVGLAWNFVGYKLFVFKK